jgi:hypothetical protein
MLTKSPKTSTSRVHRFRRRRRDGKMVVAVEVDMDVWPERLRELGFLRWDQIEDREAIGAAFSIMLIRQLTLMEDELEILRTTTCFQC